MKANSKSEYLATLLAGSPDQFWESLLHDLKDEIFAIQEASTFINIYLENPISRRSEDLLPSITTMNKHIEARTNRLRFILEAASEYRAIQHLK